MERIRLAWRALTGPQRTLSIVLPIGLAVVIAGGAALAFGRQPAPVPGPETGQVEPSIHPSDPLLPSDRLLPPEPSLAPDVSPAPAPTPAPPGTDPLLGTDGRLTVLLLGSDYRPAHPGNRTDAIMVVSLDPTTGKAAAFSVPRDTTGFPMGNGQKYAAKVNGMYQTFLSTTPHGGKAMENAIAKAFDIEVDGYVFIGFAGVKNLVGAVGGVDVTLDAPYYDAHYWVTAKQQGWGLPKGTSHLGPNDALIFARSRKGDNDFGRARRQQLLVLAALNKARTLGVAKLPRLLRIASNTVRTDLPLDRAADLFHLVSTTDISKVNGVVFGPRTYAVAAGGTDFELKLDVCRAWIKTHFPAIRPMGHWPAGSAPAASPSGSSAP